MVTLFGFIIFVESLDIFVQTIRPNYYALIGELVKALNLYSNPRIGNHSNVNKNSNARSASKRFWMQKTRSN